MTGAPFNFETPWTFAIPPWTSIFAPIRINSGACINLFSNKVSSKRLVPSAKHIKAINCACKSVAKPGYTSVLTSTAFIVSLNLFTLMPSSVSEISIPARSRLYQNSPNNSFFPPSKSTWPPAIAGAIIKVPSSIRSTTTGWVVPPKVSTPCISIVPEPSPLISAPIDLKHFTRSTISGSFAAFFKTEVPLAKDAAIMKFSVAPTEAIRISKVPAFNRPLDCACK